MHAAANLLLIHDRPGPPDPCPLRSASCVVLRRGHDSAIVRTRYHPNNCRCSRRLSCQFAQECTRKSTIDTCELCQFGRLHVFIGRSGAMALRRMPLRSSNHHVDGGLGVVRGLQGIIDVPRLRHVLCALMFQGRPVGSCGQAPNTFTSGLAVQVVNWVERHKAAICPIRGRQDQLDNIPSATRSSCARENEPKHAALLSAQ